MPWPLYLWHMFGHKHIMEIFVWWPHNLYAIILISLWFAADATGQALTGTVLDFDSSSQSLISMRSKSVDLSL